MPEKKPLAPNLRNTRSCCDCKNADHSFGGNIVVECNIYDVYCSYNATVCDDFDPEEYWREFDV